MSFDQAPAPIHAAQRESRALQRTPDVIGDFLVGLGPRAAAWVAQHAPIAGRGERLEQLDGFACRSAGATRMRRSAHRLALGLDDLVAGSADAAFDALDGTPPWADWRGRFAQLVFDGRNQHLLVASDHFGTLPLYWLEHGGELLVSSDLRLLLEAPWCERSADPAAVYHYLNFAVVPAPMTIVAQVRRLAPATELSWRDGRLRLRRYWRPEYAESRRDDDEALAGELRERIVATVERYRPPAGSAWGTFLSGGTDSSSITSILAHGGDEPVHAFSIGFDEAGYDELGFARIAARACGAQSHSARVDRVQTLAMIPRIAELFEQPFGNASAVPTHACAALAAADGRSLLLAGDGGDEVFGGNERYSKDRVMQRFHTLPGALRAVARGASAALAGSSANFANRVRNFVRRASLPNPDRFYTDDAFASEQYDALLTPEFAAAVPRDASLELMRELYAGCSASSELHRLMCLDLELAIARNDLVKVHGAARGAGVSVRYPYLDPDLVAYTGSLPERAKLRGLDKRYLFKRALKDVLPPSILQKKKQGFGLPISVWLARDADFRDFTRDTLTSRRAVARGWFQPATIDALIARHVAGEWDYSAPIWQLLVLELWLERNLDAPRAIQ